MLNTEKQEHPDWTEMQNNENQNTTYPNTIKQMSTQEDKINVELRKKIMTEKKTTLSSLRSQHWK